MKSAIVTGANGFVGSWLLKELTEHGVRVCAVVKDEKSDISKIESLPDVKIVYCDLAHLKDLPGRLKGSGYDVFYHLAWTGAGGKERADCGIQLRNVIYTCDAVKAAAEAGCRKILCAGTVTERLVERADLLNPKALNNIYGVCKNTAHSLSRIEAMRNGIECIWMQFANLYGPYSVNGNIAGYTIGELLEGEKPTFGPANQMYDLMNIRDLVRAVRLLGVMPTRQSSYYIGSGNPRPLRDYIVRIGQLCGKPDDILLGRRPDDGSRYNPEWFDILSLKADTGFEPMVNFDDGIAETIEWMKSTIQ